MWIINTYIGVIAFLFGISIGSFLNVVIYRLPKELSPAKGRSFCTSCKHTLGFCDLMPIFSYMFLLGKCRYCKKKISPRYSIVETLTGLLTVLVFARYGFNLDYIWQILTTITLLYIMIIVSFIDIDTWLIYDRFVAAIGILGFAAIFLFDVNIWERLIGMVCVSLPMFAIALIIPGAFGMGDVKLTFALGFLLGWKCTLLGMFLAILSAGIPSVIILVRNKKEEQNSSEIKKVFANNDENPESDGRHIPFGPYICGGVLAAFLFGQQIIEWYFGIFGI